MRLLATLSVSKRLTHRQIFTTATCRKCSQYLGDKTSVDIKIAPPWRVLFFGTDDFSLKHLQTLNDNRLSNSAKVVNHLEVVTPALKCEVGRYCRQQGLTTHSWPCPMMHGKFDVGVVVSFGHLIPLKIINMFPYAILNVHPSLLPRWRGASPILHTVLNGDKYTGISIMEIRPDHYDIGPLLQQVKYAVPEKITTKELSHNLAQKGSQLLLDTLADLPTLERKEHEQEQMGITYAHKVSLDNAQLDWENQTVEDIDRQYRALSDMFELRTEWQGQHVRLQQIVTPQDMEEIVLGLDKITSRDKVNISPGLPVFHKHSQTLCIKCKDGWTGWKGVVLKKTLSGLAFHNGYLTKVENRGVVFTSKQNHLDKYTGNLKTSAQSLRSIVR